MKCCAQANGASEGSRPVGRIVSQEGLQQESAVSARVLYLPEITQRPKAAFLRRTAESNRQGKWKQVLLYRKGKDLLWLMTGHGDQE